jgi:DNA-directed RNA polymerase
VKKNLSKIISLDKEFIMKASKKIQFTSFCITLKEYDKDNNYLVKLPVFLDATCSGMQHLSAILQDINMGTHVNLIKKSESENVGDLYETVVNPINVAINEVGLKDPLYKELKDVKLSRQILKPSIMTQVYAVTVYGIFRQLKSQFRKEKVIHPTEKRKDGKEKYNTFY